MPVFKTANNRLKKLKLDSFKTEKELQKLIEENIFELLDLQFLHTEYRTTSGGRIDTLAVDSDGAPVIIEYKKTRNDNVINQSLSYLKWLKTQKPDFFQKLMTDKLGDRAPENLDWKNPRVICIAEEFSRFDIDSIPFISTAIELIRYRRYDDGIFVLETIEVNSKNVTTKSSASKKEITETHTVEMHKANSSTQVCEIFDNLRDQILSLDEAIVEKPVQNYIAYKLSKNFADIHIYKNKLKINLSPIDYEDPKNMVQKVPKSFNWRMDRFIEIEDSKDCDYVFKLIEQSYKDVL